MKEKLDEKEDFFSSALIAISILILFLFFIIFILIYNYHSPIKIQPSLQYCHPGQCATNKWNGSKRCLEDVSQAIAYDAGIEVCNDRFLCNNPQTPFALQTDGTTNIMGICNEDQICRCLNYETCSSNIVTIFEQVGQNIEQKDSRSYLNQKSLSIQGNGGSEYFKINDSNTQFCSIKPYHLDRISPGACTFSNSSEINLLELQTCFRENPCILGLLAFTPKEPDKFKLDKNNKNAIYSSIVSCVSSENKNGSLKNFCEYGYVPIYNKHNNKVECFFTGND